LSAFCGFCAADGTPIRDKEPANRNGKIKLALISANMGTCLFHPGIGLQPFGNCHGILHVLAHPQMEGFDAANDQICVKSGRDSADSCKRKILLINVAKFLYLA
jgi:hypothetical protein